MQRARGAGQRALNVTRSARVSSFRISWPYLTSALAIFLVELLIARFAHDAVVRPLLGDVLVIALIYCVVRGVLALPVGWTVLGVFLFACAIELGQAVQLVARLGLEHNRLARIVIGTAYDPRDFVAYALGAALVLLGERLAGPRG